jgi:hypothetical protein
MKGLVAVKGGRSRCRGQSPIFESSVKGQSPDGLEMKIGVRPRSVLTGDFNGCLV